MSRRLHIIKAGLKLQAVSALVITLLCAFTVRDQITPAYQVKAAFLFNFTQFVEWPASSYGGNNAPFVIGILGEDPFGDYLADIVKDERVGSRPIVIKKYKDVDDVKNCNILYINMPGAAQAAKALHNRSILTVSDEDDFAQNGGMVRFFTQNNKIKLRINPAVARAANLEISAKLLRVAEIIEK